MRAEVMGGEVAFMGDRTVPLSMAHMSFQTNWARAETIFGEVELFI